MSNSMCIAQEIIIFPRNVSSQEYYVFVSNAAAASASPRHNLVVSAITFEGFKLRSSNLTHALLIQISRTSSIIDLVIPSKMGACGHFVKNIFFKSCVLIWNGQKCDRKLFADIQNGRQRPFCQKFKQKKSSVWIWNGQKGHRKWISDIQNGWSIWNYQNGYRSEMARNVIESEFRTSKMADVSHFVKNFKKK